MMEKIVMIGPVYPYKGGISHYTGLLYRTLYKKYDVSMISYKFQYPRLLYKKKQKDYSNDSFKIENVKYIINTLNPFSWLQCVKEIRSINPNIIIIQWWHPFFAPCYWTLCRHLKKYKKLFICHNVFPHERFPMDKFLTKNVLRQGDCYIVQSEKDATDLNTIIQKPCYLRTVHPTYNAFKIQNISKIEAREKLGLKDEKVLLFFGFVREYKGLKYLIEAMPIIVRTLEDIKLLIVGDFANVGEKEEYQKLIQENNVASNISIYDGYVPDKEVEKYFGACDLVVLPYISATQSGIVQIAYGFEKPVVVTNVGGLPDVVEDGKTGYVVEACNKTELATAIIRFFNLNMEKHFVEETKKEAYRFEWDRMMEAIEKLMIK